MRGSYEIRLLNIIAICCFALAAFAACKGVQQRTVVSAAEVVNEVAKKGDHIDAVSVEICHEAESAAADLPDLDRAEKLVMEIRGRCDMVFTGIDKLEQAIKHVDLVFEAVQRNDATVEDLVNAAMKARQAYEHALEANEALRELLEKETLR
jgi:N-acetylglucosamine kinase-like BadF-type ATPase